MSNNLLGGRGPCNFCHEWHNNVAYHSEWECELNPRGFKARQHQESTSADLVSLYESAFEKLTPAKKFPKVIPNELQRSFEEAFGKCDCDYPADGAACTKCGRTAVELPVKPSETELDDQYYKNLDEFEAFFSPKPIESQYSIHKELTGTPSIPNDTAKDYVGLNITCSGCQTKITKPAALLFSPPQKHENHDFTKKYHLCRDCFELACIIVGICD